MGADADGGGGSGFSGPGKPSNGTAAAAGVAGPAQALKHNPGLSVDWSPEEQAILEEELDKHASESSIIRYAKIAMSLPNKTVRDVALRCRWMTKKESGKRRKEDHNLSKKSKDKKERVTDALAKPSAHLGSLPNAPLYPLPMLPMDDDGITYKVIGGRTGQLLESNADAFTKISANLASLKVQDNISLLCQTRDNILTILADLNDMPEIMKQMPPLPVKMNEELADSILPRTTVPMQS
ncbi:uncharacterized protein LOC135586794 [Musa acuminata AAA Group]|uniref:uncharacterized protein LOC135586794 n=1 Tax=Musa acuminata AAA Group TaxID=214697 RepID=UPI0031D5451A